MATPKDKVFVLVRGGTLGGGSHSERVCGEKATAVTFVAVGDMVETLPAVAACLHTVILWAARVGQASQKPKGS